MIRDRLHAITGKFARLRIAVVGDFCLDRYLEIDDAKQETSIETGLPVHNVVNVRAQPGGAGTVLANLSALGIGTIIPIGFHGDDGEGYELRRALGALPGVQLNAFLQTPDRRTFTYCKPLVIEAGSPPRELNRLDSKNWTPTPRHITGRMIGMLRDLRPHVDAVVAVDQVDIPETGVLTSPVREALESFGKIPVIADSRQGLQDYPRLIFKMNAAEFRKLTGIAENASIDQTLNVASELATKNNAPVFVTLAERGIVGAHPSGVTRYIPALPTRGPIDIVGAGDSVTANLTAAIAAGAQLEETLQLSMLAASVVIHKLGTTGTASVSEIQMVN